MKNVLNTLCLERRVLFYKEKQVSMNDLYFIYTNDFIKKLNSSSDATIKNRKNSNALRC